MFETLVNAFKVKEIRKKIFITLLLLLVYRLGCYIPVPGLDAEQFSVYFDPDSEQFNNFLSLMNAVTGGALSQGTLFALGISPYINASIIIQLLCVGIPALERLSKEGEEGKRKIAQITRFLTLALAIIQSVGVIINFGNDGAINTSFFWDQAWLAYIYMVILYSAGAMLTMWLGERITEYGVGNGISLVIFVGIISTAGLLLVDKFITAFTAATFTFTPILEIILFFVVAVILFGLIVLVDLAERRIPVQYAKQVKGRKMYGGQRSEIPMRIAASGVMPLIFAFALISLPGLIISIFWPNSEANTGWTWFTTNWPYPIVLCLLIFFFAFFYSNMQFNPDDVAKSIQQNGGFIQGIRPGRPTAEYLKKIWGRITLFGAIYLSLVAFIPSLLFSFISNDGDLVNVFSTTGILIVVSVAMEFEKQLQSQLMMKNYKGFLK